MAEAVDTPRPEMGTKRSQLALAFLLAGCVCLGAVTLYWPSLSQPFQFDDQLFLRDDNVRLARWRAFVFPPVRRSLTWLTFLVQYQVSGPSPAAYHAVNLVLHALNSVLVFLFLALLFGKRGEGGGNPESAGAVGAGRLLSAAFGGLLFAMHPLQTESVLLAYQRSTLLAALFSFLSLFCWIFASRNREAVGREGMAFTLAGILFLMAVAAKESAVVLPLLFWTWDGLFGRRWRPSPKLLVLLFFGGFFALAIALGSVETGQLATSQGLAGGVVYAATEVRVLWLYLGLLMGVGSQNVDHDVVAQSVPWDPIWWLAAVGLVLLLSAFWKTRRGNPELAFFGFAFFLFLLPSSGFLPSPDFAFEHRVYASMLGVAGLAGLTFLEVCRRLAGRRWRTASWWARGAAGLALLACAGSLVAMAVSTRDRMAVWREPVALWRDAVAKSPGKYRPNFNLGVLLLDRSPAEADRYLSRAIEIDPSQPLAYRSLGEARLREGDDGAAETLWKQALLLKPDDFDTLLALGKLDRSRHRFFEAKQRLEAAERLRPDDWEVQYQLGLLQQDFGFVAESVPRFERALGLNPRLPALYFALAEPMARTSNWDRAIELYRQGLDLSPKDARAHYRLALIYWQAGRGDEARAAVKKGLEVAESESEIEIGRALLDSH